MLLATDSEGSHVSLLGHIARSQVNWVDAFWMQLLMGGSVLKTHRKHKCCVRLVQLVPLKIMFA